MAGTQSNSTFESTTAVNCLAVTEVTEDTFVFGWNIKGFKICLQDKEITKSLASPAFCIDEGKIKHQWYLTITWSEKEKRTGSDEEDEYLSIHLHLVNSKTPAKVSFQFEILNSEKCWKQRASSQVRKFDKSTGPWGWNTFAKIEEILDPVNKLLEDDTLNVQCRIKMIRDEGRIVSSSEATKSCKRKYDLISDIGDLYNSPTFTDVSIQARNSVFKANKSILSCRSPVFSAMFQAEMTEAITNVVKICDFDDDVVDGMLKYIYSGEIIQELLEKKAMDLFQIADKYDIKGLKEDSEEVISRNLSVENVSETIIYADINNAPNLKERALKFFTMNTTEVKNTEGYQNLLKYNPSIFRDLFQTL